MSAIATIRELVHLARGTGTSPLMKADEAQRVYDSVSAEALSAAADAVELMLAFEPDTARASALYDALTQLRAKLPCTCARSQGLHEKRCTRYVPGHELLSPTRALARARDELRRMADAAPAAHPKTAGGTS